MEEVVILIIIVSLLLFWVMVDEFERGKIRKYKRDKSIMKSRLKSIKSKNPGLEFPIQSFSFTPNEKTYLRWILGWPEDKIDFDIPDVLNILPKQIIVPPEFQEGSDDIEKKPETYTLSFDSQLRPEYIKWGWEGADDTLPYSEYGSDDWFMDKEYGGWKHARMKKPEEIGVCYIKVLKFLVENGFLKVEDNNVAE